MAFPIKAIVIFTIMQNMDVMGFLMPAYTIWKSGIAGWGIWCKSVMLSGFAGVAVKTKTSKYRLNILHLQNGESKAGIFDYKGADQGSEFSGFQHNLEYSERSLTTVLFDGKHH